MLSFLLLLNSSFPPRVILFWYSVLFFFSVISFFQSFSLFLCVISPFLVFSSFFPLCFILFSSFQLFLSYVSHPLLYLLNLTLFCISSFFLVFSYFFPLPPASFQPCCTFHFPFSSFEFLILFSLCVLLLS